MRIRLEEISISLPAGFQPLISSSFANEQTNETVSVGQGGIPPGATGSADILAQRVEEFETKLGVPVTKYPVQPITLLGRSGHQTFLSFRYGTLSMQAWWAVTNLDKNRFLQITYMTPDADGAAKKFERMVRSATLPDKATDALAGPGWVNRYAGLIALDIPANLPPPHVYSFVSANGHQNIEIKLYASNSDAGPAPKLVEEIASDTQAGENIADNTQQTMTVSSGVATHVSYVLTKKELTGDQVSVVHRVRIDYKSGLVVLLDVRGPSTERTQLDAVFQELTASVQPLKP